MRDVAESVKGIGVDKIQFVTVPTAGLPARRQPGRSGRPEAATLWAGHPRPTATSAPPARRPAPRDHDAADGHTRQDPGRGRQRLRHHRPGQAGGRGARVQGFPDPTSGNSDVAGQGRDRRVLRDGRRRRPAPSPRPSPAPPSRPTTEDLGGAGPGHPRRRRARRRRGAQPSRRRAAARADRLAPPRARRQIETRKADAGHLRLTRAHDRRVAQKSRDAATSAGSSSASRRALRSSPPAYPVREPSAPTTRWHGMRMLTGLRPTACPTRCGEPRAAELARDRAVGGRRAVGDRRRAGPRRAPRRRQPCVAVGTVKCRPLAARGTRRAAAGRLENRVAGRAGPRGRSCRPRRVPVAREVQSPDDSGSLPSATASRSPRSLVTVAWRRAQRVRSRSSCCSGSGRLPGPFTITELSGCDTHDERPA